MESITVENAKVEFKLTEKDIARLIWQMNCKEQSNLLAELAVLSSIDKSAPGARYNQMFGVTQYVTGEMGVYDADLIGKFIDDLHEYAGSEALRLRPIA